MAIYEEHPPLLPQTFIVDATRQVVHGGGALVLSEAEVETRADVDNHMGPILVCQVISTSTLENGPMFAGLKMRFTWYVTDESMDKAEEMATALMAGLNRLWRDGKPVAGGWIANLELSGPTLGGLQSNTADYAEFRVSGIIVARSKIQKEG